MGAPPRVVILGGGFAGLYAARGLARAPVRITLVDQHNHHLFQPLLYQVATAVLNPSDIALPLRRIFRHQPNLTVLLGEAVAIDAAARRVRLCDEELEYDQLVVATGATHSYFGHDEWAGLAPGLKKIDDALEIRRRVLLAFEAAEREEDPAARRAWLTFVIVGGGPTGVELAGALGEIAHQTLTRDFRRIRPGDAAILLVEGLDRILTAYPPALSEKAQRRLERLGVTVRLRAKVTGIEPGGVLLGDERIAARTTIWSAGVQASPLARSLGVPLDRAGRVLVAPDLSLPGHPEVFVIGDLAAVPQDGGWVPGIAPAAIQEGRHTAKNVIRAARGQPTVPFRYRDKGMLATIGRAAAVAKTRRYEGNGFVAWVLWLVVHIYFLIGFRNRLLVLFSWGWSYFTAERGARLITGERHPLVLRAPARAEPPRPDGPEAPAPPP